MLSAPGQDKKNMKQDRFFKIFWILLLLIAKLEAGDVRVKECKTASFSLESKELMRINVSTCFSNISNWDKVNIWQECCCFKVEILGAGSESEKARIRQMVRGKNSDLCHFHFLFFFRKSYQGKLSLSIFQRKHISFVLFSLSVYFQIKLQRKDMDEPLTKDLTVALSLDICSNHSLTVGEELLLSWKTLSRTP